MADIEKPGIQVQTANKDTRKLRVDWYRVFIIGGIPLLAALGAIKVPLQHKTAISSVVYYFFTGISLSAGKDLF
jgi:hypothetical protein